MLMYSSYICFQFIHIAFTIYCFQKGTRASQIAATGNCVTLIHFFKQFNFYLGWVCFVLFSTPWTPKAILQGFSDKGPYGFPASFTGLWQLRFMLYSLLLLETNITLIDMGHIRCKKRCKDKWLFLCSECFISFEVFWGFLEVELFLNNYLRAAYKGNCIIKQEIVHDKEEINQ